MQNILLLFKDDKDKNILQIKLYIEKKFTSFERVLKK